MMGYVFLRCIWISKNCKYFIPIENDSSINLSATDISTVENLKINIIDGNTKVKVAVRKEDLRTTNITTRDIDIGNYEHFLKKKSMIQLILLRQLITIYSLSQK